MKKCTKTKVKKKQPSKHKQAVMSIIEQARVHADSDPETLMLMEEAIEALTRYIITRRYLIEDRPQW